MKILLLFILVGCNVKEADDHIEYEGYPADTVVQKFEYPSSGDRIYFAIDNIIISWAEGEDTLYIVDVHTWEVIQTIPTKLDTTAGD